MEPLRSLPSRNLMLHLIKRNRWANAGGRRDSGGVQTRVAVDGRDYGRMWWQARRRHVWRVSVMSGVEPPSWRGEPKDAAHVEL
jgi:hypothetical protein